MQRVVAVYRWLSGMLHSAHNYFTELDPWPCYQCLCHVLPLFFQDENSSGRTVLWSPCLTSSFSHRKRTLVGMSTGRHSTSGMMLLQGSSGAVSSYRR